MTGRVSEQQSAREGASPAERAPGTVPTEVHPRTAPLKGVSRVGGDGARRYCDNECLPLLGRNLGGTAERLTFVPFGDEGFYYALFKNAFAFWAVHILKFYNFGFIILER